VPVEAWPKLIFVSLALSLAAFVWSFRAGFLPKECLAWSVFVFCFGLPGLLVFRLISDWPVRNKCFSKPDAFSRDGTEIFDQVALSRKS
jgi:hypothetical protein